MAPEGGVGRSGCGRAGRSRGRSEALYRGTDRGRVSGNKEKKQKKEGSDEHAKNRRRKSNRTNRSISRVRGSCACCRCLRLVGAWLVGGSPAQESRRNFDPRGGTKFAKNDDDDPVTKGRAPGDKGAVQRRTLREAWRALAHRVDGCMAGSGVPRCGGARAGAPTLGPEGGDP